MSTTGKTEVLIAGNELTFIRTFDAPRSLVYKVWTDPAHMAQWWGPKDFTNPVYEIDLQPGGEYRYVMRAPDGAEYPGNGVFVEIIANEKLVMTDDCSQLPEEWHDLVNPERDKSAGTPALEAIVTVTFEEQDGKTRLTIHYLYESAATVQGMLRTGMEQGWSESLDRLEVVLSNLR